MNELNDNLPADFDDLSKHAPLLDALRSKEAGFVVPENYFTENAKIVDAKTALPSQEGFTVPENYFEELAERILAVVQLKNAHDPSFGFVIPENYFEDLTERIAALTQLPNVTPGESFAVPENYFDELNDSLQTKLALDNVKQDDGFGVPENYFEKLSGKILSRVATEELQKNDDVPAGYFDSLADRISQRIAEEEQTDSHATERGRVIVFAEVVKRFARPAAIAASAALLIAVSLWFLNRDTTPEKQLAKNDTTHPQSITPVVPQPPQQPAVAQQPVKDSVPQQQKIAVVQPHKKQRTVNLPEPAPVKVEKQDAMEQLDLIDETTVAGYVNGTAEQSTEDSNTELLPYLLDGTMDPSEYINLIQDKK